MTSARAMEIISTSRFFKRNGNYLNEKKIDRAILTLSENFSIVSVKLKTCDLRSQESLIC